MVNVPARGAHVTIGADSATVHLIEHEANGRALLIDFYASRCCTSALVGDLETRWLDPDQTADLESFGTVSGTPIVAHRRLAIVLQEGRARIVRGGWRRRSLQVRLDAPEVWLEFLETPAAHRSRSRRSGEVTVTTPPTT